MNRKCRQNVASDDRRTFTDKDKLRHIQTLGCHVLLNCQKPRSSYVTSILITKVTSTMFLLKLSALSTAIFLFVSLVLLLLCRRSTGVFRYCFFFSIRYQTLISDFDKFILALFIVR